MSMNDPMNRDPFREEEGSSTMGWGIAAVAVILVLGFIVWGMSGTNNVATNSPPPQTTGQGSKMAPPPGATNPTPETTGQGSPPASTTTPPVPNTPAPSPNAPPEVPAVPPTPAQPKE